MKQVFHYKHLEEIGVYDGKDYFDFQINSILSHRNLPEGARSRLLTALTESYSDFVEYLSLKDPDLPQDLTWSQLKLLRMELEELNRERDYRMADYFCREVADQVIVKEIAECKKLGIC